MTPQLASLTTLGEYDDLMTSQHTDEGMTSHYDEVTDDGNSWESTLEDGSWWHEGDTTSEYTDTGSYAYLGIY